MSFPDAIKSAFQNYVNFSGRARRSEYWYFTLFTAIVDAVLSGAQQAGMSFAGVLAGVFSLAILVPSLSISWRRLHDIGKSGLWNFIALVPIVGWILIIYWDCKDSDPETNEYGPCPK